MLQETFSRTQNHKSLNVMSLLSGQQNDRKNKTHIKEDHC